MSPTPPRSGRLRAAAPPATTSATRSPTSRPCPRSGEAADRLCVESPMQGVAIGPSDKTPGNASQTVNGNYGVRHHRRRAVPDHGRSQHLRAGPVRRAARRAHRGPRPRRLHRRRRHPEEPGRRRRDVQGDQRGGRQRLRRRRLPAAGEPRLHHPCGGGDAPPGAGNDPIPPTQPPSQQAGIISPCAGALHTVRVERPALPRRRRQPLRGSGPAVVRRQAGHGPRRPDDGTQLQPLHGRADPDALLGSHASTTSA